MKPSLKPIHLAVTTLLVAAGVTLASCVEPGPAAPDLSGPPPKPSLEAGVSALSEGGLLKCRPMAAASATVTIGPSGGDIKVGRHVLSIPGGALKQRTMITALAPSDTVNRIQFQPDGLTFQKPVLLVMSYANCSLDRPTAREIVYVDDRLKVLGHQPSKDDPAGKRVGGLLTHFSQYAVSW
jgi:hypothetical protein